MERMFWLICISISAYGSYYLIKQYQYTFEENAISIVIEEIRPVDKVQFPSLGICELGHAKENYAELEEIVKKLHKDYNYDVEDFLLRIIFQNMYSYGSLAGYCAQYYECSDDCAKCPTNGYEIIASEVRSNCSKLFRKCIWKGIEFDCCNYFLPINTTMGQCFLLNSIQITERNSNHWLDMEIDWDEGDAFLEVNLTRPISIHVLNEEDIPHSLLKTLQFASVNQGFASTLKINMINIINDPGVQQVSLESRKCLFPEEVPENMTYKYYSFSACVTDCLKEAQLKACNCTNYNLVLAGDNSPKCDLEGFLCLDIHDLLYPQTTIMQPWRSNGLVCHCQPSCNEREIQIIEKTFSVNPETPERSIRVSLQSLPTEQYRRQAVRDKLDIVVSIGGILGLFLGASILSAVELLYFFTTRILGNVYQNLTKK